MNIFQRIVTTINNWIDKQRYDRDKVDKMAINHQKLKDEQRYSPAGFEATEIDRHKMRGASEDFFRIKTRKRR